MKIRNQYYSIYFGDCDPNFPEEIVVLSHENEPRLDDEYLDNEMNHFKTKKEAEEARKGIIKLLGKVK